ncbi:hypothetical protein [Riemerella anatipestifer]|uniref:DUF3828 domain-containing protein n=1 Tax=Riemerella anatipestifer TaxID=34085 RepID=A0A1S7DPC4_RIEAN|nr:hypothetical protein [Riemerella anatipestifer]AQY20976.1 hypothetical protein AB406_0010 [Riemerella anatipestifer]
MKKIIYIFIFGQTLFTSGNEKQNKSQINTNVKDTIVYESKQKNKEPQIVQNKSQIETIKSFLYWYKKNQEKLYQFNTIKGGAFSQNNEQIGYYVDFDEVKKEINFLKESDLFSQNFLKEYEMTYNEGSQNFKKNPQNDGPPFGFDYDYFFLTQDDYEADLKQIEKINFKLNEVNEKLSFVSFNLKNCGMTYKYTLIKSNKWQIDKIENVN